MSVQNDSGQPQSSQEPLGAGFRSSVMEIRPSISSPVGLDAFAAGKLAEGRAAATKPIHSGLIEGKKVSIC